MQLELWDLKYKGQNMAGQAQRAPNKNNKNAILTTVLVKQPDSFLVVRLMSQEGAAWGVGFEIHGWREWQKIADQEQRVTIK